VSQSYRAIGRARELQLLFLRLHRAGPGFSHIQHTFLPPAGAGAKRVTGFLEQPKVNPDDARRLSLQLPSIVEPLFEHSTRARTAQNEMFDCSPCGCLGDFATANAIPGQGAATSDAHYSGQIQPQHAKLFCHRRMGRYNLFGVVSLQTVLLWGTRSSAVGGPAACSRSALQDHGISNGQGAVCCLRTRS
jgi:hypothetical protein